MMAQDNTLPARQGTGRMAGGYDPLENVVPGSWWRLSGAFKDLEDRDLPDHGLVLLVHDVRVIDGEIHTIVLREHPRWGEGSYKILLEDFLVNFTFQPDGEALREKELLDLMEEINGITRLLSSPPSDRDLMAALPAPEAPVAPVEAKVPTVLLPSGDVNAAQARIETAIAVMEARRDWVSGHTRDMQSKMALVGSFQKEKVDVALAGISEQRKAAENLLSGVQTMRLFLGEDQDFRTLVEGQGAARSEPLHFMQRMLYLDEELFTHSRLDGLNGDDFNDLPKILSDNPELVSRMLPHPRSVAIAKMRRKTRELDFEINLSNIFEVMNIVEQDRRIQILIRNGDQVHMVTTDEITSKATRLFPSRSEIDHIFTQRDRQGGYRTITPHDIEYSDKRSDHDARALFYKRVLLILWGLSEREGVLGDFIENGSNWLEETVHNKNFTFVHDEEDVLPDGRYPPINRFLDQNRRAVQHGSRLLVQWGNAISEDSAPQMYEKRDRGSSYAYMKNQPVVDFSLTIAQRKDGDIIALCPVTRQSWRSDRDRQFNSPVKLKTTVLSWNKFQDRTSGGFICLDTLKAEDLRHYFNSRIHRENYLEYLHLFDRALTILAREEAELLPIRAGILSRVEVDEEIVDQALHIWRTANRGDVPLTEKEIAKVEELCAFLSVELPELDSDVLYVDATSRRTLEVSRLREVEVFGRKIPVAEVDTMTWGPRVGWRVKAGHVATINTEASPGAFRLQGQAPEHAIQAFEIIHPALRDPASLDILCNGLADEGLETLGRMKSFLGADPDFDVDGLLHEAGDYFSENLRNRESVVVVPVIRQTLGYTLDTHGSSQVLMRISLTVHPDYQALANGSDDALSEFLTDLYQNPERRLSRLKQDLETGRINPSSINVERLGDDVTISRDPSLKGLNFEKENHYSFSIIRQDKEDGFIKKDNFMSGGDIRELIVHRIASHGYYRPPSTIEDMARYMDEIHFMIFPGCAELIEAVSGMSLNTQPAIEVLGEISDEPSPE